MLYTICYSYDNLDFRNQHAVRMLERANKVKAKLPPGYHMTPEQERSMYHMEAGTICKCGRKETKLYKGKWITVTVGFHKMVKCRKCPGCKTPQCQNCRACLNPSIKRFCDKKFCYFPKTPKCPDYLRV